MFLGLESIMYFTEKSNKQVHHDDLDEKGRKEKQDYSKIFNWFWILVIIFS